MKDTRQKIMDITKIPQDAIEEILSRLPPKPLARFKCVSKSWYALISTRSFVKKHLARTLSNPSHDPFRILTYYCYESLDYESPSSLDSAPNDDAVEDLNEPLGLEDPCMDRRVIGSCDGVIAFLYEFDEKRIILWNPCTRVARELPPPPPSVYQNATAFYGFGYDNSIDDYKVVKVVRSDSTNETTAYVFCINDDSWRTINGPDKNIAVHKMESCYFHGPMGTFLNGALHWLADRGKLGVILRFDLTGETFSELTQPATDDPSKMFEFLWVLNGRLGLLSSVDLNGIEFWVMKEYGISTSWSKLFSTGDNFEYGEYVAPLCVAKNGDVIMDIDGWSTVRYKVQEKTFEYLKTHHPDMHQCTLYVQSLVSPCASNSHIGPDENIYKHRPMTHQAKGPRSGLESGQVRMNLLSWGSCGTTPTRPRGPRSRRTGPGSGWVCMTQSPWGQMEQH